MKIWIPKHGFDKYEKNGLFLLILGNLVLSHQKYGPPFFNGYPFLLVDCGRKSKIRSNQPEIH